MKKRSIDDVHAIDVMVNVAKSFAGEFAGGVGRNGGKNRVALGKRDLGIHAIDGRGGGDGDFFDAVLAGGFEDVDGAFDVDALVKGGFFEAGPDAGASGEMDDLIEFGGRE